MTLARLAAWREAGGTGASYPVGMARSPFTLAALAAAAVPGLEIARVGRVAADDCDAAAITDAEGRSFLVRIPRSKDADTRVRAELAGLAALTTGARDRLPFAVLEPRGAVSYGPTRAVVTDFPYGATVSVRELGERTALGAAVGAAVAAVHSLPATVVTDAGLPVSGPADSKRRAAAVFERAEATKLLPAAVEGRWLAALDDADLWQFQPTVVGGFDVNAFLTEDDEVVTVTGWHGLAIGDPASDLAFLAQDERAADAVLGGYARVRGGGDRRLRGRAAFFSELELARWLLHGWDLRSPEILDDAVDMLTTLAERVHGHRSARIEEPTAPVLTVTEVEDLLEQTRKAV